MYWQTSFLDCAGPYVLHRNLHCLQAFTVWLDMKSLLR